LVRRSAAHSRATNRLVRDGKALFVLSLLSPYLAFLVALRFELSGVLAVVVAGFIVAWRIHHIEPSIRVDLFATWSYLTHVLNGLCFLFVGLAAPYVVCHLSGDTEMTDLIHAGLGVSAAVVVTRILWCFPNAYLPLWLMPNFRRKEGGYPSPRNVFLVSWCGARGIVSLAAALALPETLADGTPFPGRDEVIACTLAVILVTLIGQGLTLQPIIRLLGIRDDDATEAERRRAREVVLEAGIQQLDAYCSETSCPISVAPLSRGDERRTRHPPRARRRSAARCAVAARRVARGWPRGSRRAGASIAAVAGPRRDQRSDLPLAATRDGPRLDDLSATTRALLHTPYGSVARSALRVPPALGSLAR
jgi:NhaP-type Na+/H+ or K+/H+ antiporter